MDYLDEIRSAHSDPIRLEDIYRSAVQKKSLKAFQHAVEECAHNQPDNLLYQAWQTRLEREIEFESQKASRMSYWKIAIPIAILNGLITWLLSDLELLI